MRGIVLAGGSGSRLHPVTKAVSKQLLPIYNRPLIHFPLATLMAAGLREILLIVTPEHLEAFRRLLGDGSDWGVDLQYAVQPRPDGLAQAFLIGERFLDGHGAALILGDNIFHGPGLGRSLQQISKPAGGHIFAYPVQDPSSYGVVEFDSVGSVLSLEEKPITPRSHYAVPGLYFYAPDVVDVAKRITPSARGELEITAVNQAYLAENRLTLTVLSRGTAWMDAGTYDSLMGAGEYVRSVEQRQGISIGSPEEVACRNGWITTSDLEGLALGYGDTPYGHALMAAANLISSELTWVATD